MFLLDIINPRTCFPKKRTILVHPCVRFMTYIPNKLRQIDQKLTVLIWIGWKMVWHALTIGWIRHFPTRLILSFISRVYSNWLLKILSKAVIFPSIHCWYYLLLSYYDARNQHFCLQYECYRWRYKKSYEAQTSHYGLKTEGRIHFKMSFLITDITTFCLSVLVVKARKLYCYKVYKKMMLD